MAMAIKLGLCLTAATALLATGCVGPMACGPNGCSASGPLAWGSCDGGDCRGCGELYIDPWINHRADVCDPCDGCGNYNGQSCGKCRPIFSGYRSLWGYRRDPGPPPCSWGSCGGCDGGCDSHGGASLPPSMHYQEQPHYRGQQGIPTPAPEVIWEDEPSEVTRSADQARFEPQRTRQIFRSRGGVASAAPRPRGH